MDDIENLRGKAGRALEQISADREEAQKVRVAYDDLREKMAQSEAQGGRFGWRVRTGSGGFARRMAGGFRPSRRSFGTNNPVNKRLNHGRSSNIYWWARF